ncbi:hypothetical protein MAJ_00848, partial [Metarhizium majus ARSEF 297]
MRIIERGNPEAGAITNGEKKGSNPQKIRSRTTSTYKIYSRCQSMMVDEKLQPHPEDILHFNNMWWRALLLPPFGVVAKLSVRSLNRNHVMKVILANWVLHVILFSWTIEVYVKLNTGYPLWQDKFRIRNSS